MFQRSCHPSALTKVHVVIPSTLAVHLVDEEAGHRFDQQAEDGHAGTEAEDVVPPIDWHFIGRVIDAEVDDVGEYRQEHSHQELQERMTGEDDLNYKKVDEINAVNFFFKFSSRHLPVLNVLCFKRSNVKEINSTFFMKHLFYTKACSTKSHNRGSETAAIKTMTHKENSNSK